MGMQAVTSATGRPGVPMKGTDTVADGEIDALNERRLDDAGEAMSTDAGHDGENHTGRAER